MGEYTDYPADYAEVSSYQSGQQSPAPYATTTLIGSSKLAPNDAHRFNNMFYKTDIYPNGAIAANAVAMMQNGSNNNNNNGSSNNNNNNNYNRSIHSDSYCNSNNSKMNIMENRIANTMMPNMFNQHQPNGIKMSSNKRNRLKLMKPQSIRNYFSNSPNEQLYVKVGEINQIGPHSSSSQQSHTPQSTQSGSINWSQHNFNIYENQLHNHMNGSATMNNEPDNSNRNDVENDNDDDDEVDSKDFIYNGNRSIMSYMSSKDFPENV